MSEEDLLGATYELQDTEETFAHYEAWARTYDKEVGDKHQYAQPERCAAALLEALDPCETQVLDVGCGTGLSGLALTEVGFGTVDGCDLSPAMLEEAARRGVYRQLFEVNLNNGIDLHDDFYDAVTAVGVLSFGHVRADAMWEMLRVIRHGGVLVVGLNEHYWKEGDVLAELGAIEAAGQARVAKREFGDHLPGAGISGWVATIVKA